jgi:hypothetical protein
METNPRSKGSALALAIAITATGFCSPVQAAPPQAVTITTQVVFNPDVQGTFTATGPVCASGTVELVREKITAGEAFNVNAWTRFICDDNSGSFVLHVHPQFNSRPKDGFDASGPWAVWGAGGTGLYATLTGHGWFGVVFDWSTDPLEGSETLVGFMSLE